MRIRISASLRALVFILVFVEVLLDRCIVHLHGVLHFLEHDLREDVLALEIQLALHFGRLVQLQLFRFLRQQLQLNDVLRELTLSGASRILLILVGQGAHEFVVLSGSQLFLRRSPE
jgi:hypothetical protein